MAREYARTFAPLLSPTEFDLVDGLSPSRDHPYLGASDAVLAATALRREATAFLSTDRAFASVPGLPHIAPGSEELERFLSA